jgi:hypothetical protein
MNSWNSDDAGGLSSAEPDSLDHASSLPPFDSGVRRRRGNGDVFYGGIRWVGQRPG